MTNINFLHGCRHCHKCMYFVDTLKLADCYFYRWEHLSEVSSYALWWDGAASKHACHNRLLTVTHRLCSSRAHTITSIVGEKEASPNVKLLHTQISHGDVSSVKEKCFVFFAFFCLTSQKWNIACCHNLYEGLRKSTVPGHWPLVGACAEECMLNSVLMSSRNMCFAWHREQAVRKNRVDVTRLD